jgi:hypothetical protein
MKSMVLWLACPNVGFVGSGIKAGACRSDTTEVDWSEVASVDQTTRPIRKLWFRHTINEGSNEAQRGRLAHLNLKTQTE